MYKKKFESVAARREAQRAGGKKGGIAAHRRRGRQGENLGEVTTIGIPVADKVRVRDFGAAKKMNDVEVIHLAVGRL